MANIREIAALAGVSRSTVSLVLNNSPLVKTETREKVKRVIRQAKYVPNSNARGLSRRVMGSLGIIVLSDQRRSRSYELNDSVGLYSLNVIRGITSRLADTAYAVNIEYFCAEEGTGLPALVRERRVDGAFIVGGYCDAPFIRMMLDSGVPFVTVAVGAPEKECDSVCADPALGAYESLRYLSRRGHARIGFINCPRSFRSARLREEGAARAQRDGAGALAPDGMRYCAHNNGQGGYDAMREAWQSGLRFDGIATANPQIAMGAIRFLREQGVDVPHDVSFIAYEDNSLCGYSSPPLTAINIQKEAMGERAADMLLRRVADRQKPVESEIVSAHLVERGSVLDRRAHSTDERKEEQSQCGL